MRYIIGQEPGPAWHVYDTRDQDYVLRGESHAVATQTADQLNRIVGEMCTTAHYPSEIDEVAEAIGKAPIDELIAWGQRVRAEATG